MANDLTDLSSTETQREYLNFLDDDVIIVFFYEILSALFQDDNWDFL